MPRAAHGVTHHQSLVKRPTQMAASGADSEDLVTAAGEQRPCTADMAYFHAAMGISAIVTPATRSGPRSAASLKTSSTCFLWANIGCAQRVRLQNQQLQRAGEAAELDLAGTLWLLHRRSIASFTRLT